jgi:hypothetical protein
MKKIKKSIRFKITITPNRAAQNEVLQGTLRFISVILRASFGAKRFFREACCEALRGPGGSKGAEASFREGIAKDNAKNF